MSPEFEVAVLEERLMITANLPGLRSEQLEITVNGNHLRLVSKQAEGCGPFDRIVEIPHGFNLSQASAAYLNGQLRVVIPPQTEADGANSLPPPFSNN